MIKLIFQIGLAVIAMATLIPMTAIPQANEGVKEVTSSVAETAVGNTQHSSGENNQNSEFSKNSNFQTLPNVATNFEVQVQTRFNEIRRELLDEQASFIDRWLNVIAIVLTFFGVVIAIAVFIGFSRFREIEKEAKSSVKIVTDAAEVAEHHLLDIQKKSDEATDMIKGMQAESAAENPTVATRTIANIRENPDASLVEKAIADAMSLQQQGKQEDAIEKWRAIAEITEESDNALAARAWFSIGFLSSVDNIPEKISSYDRAIQLKPDMAEAYSNRGNAKGGLGRYEDAIIDYDKAIQLKPDMAEAYSNRGAAKGGLERHKDAIIDYDKAIQLKPDLADTYSNRGSSKSDLGRHEDAIIDYDRAIQLKPDLADAYSNRGSSKSDLGRHEDAIIDYDRAIQLKPDLADAYSNRGNAKSKLGRYEDAIIDYDKAIQLKPDLAEAYSNRGNAKGGLGRHEDAIIDYDKATQLKPDMAEVYFNRGSSKNALGVKVEAISDLQIALKLARISDNVNMINLAEQILHSLGAINDN